MAQATHRPLAELHRGWSNVSVHIVAHDILIKLTGIQTGTWPGPIPQGPVVLHQD
jgi:hypothetical protein